MRSKMAILQIFLFTMLSGMPLKILGRVMNTSDGPDEGDGARHRFRKYVRLIPELKIPYDQAQNDQEDGIDSPFTGII